jgi:hypothetical protein
VTSAGRRPTVAVHGGVLRVAWERASTVPEMAQEVVVARQEPGGAFVIETTISTARSQRRDPVLHARDGRLWLDWKHGADVFGYVRYDQGGWSAIDAPTWPDPSWVGVEAKRKEIAAQILAP